MGKLSTVISTGDTASRLSRLTIIGATALLIAPVFTAPRDAHPGDTRQTRHVYLHWSAEPQQGVGEAPGRLMRNKKAAIYCPRW